MKNILDYLHKETQSFEEKPFNPIDSLILSQLSYLNFERIARPRITVNQEIITNPHLLSKLVFEAPLADRLLEFIQILCRNPRFNGIIAKNIVSKFDEMSETQFFAVTFGLQNDTNYIAFRGTDSTLVGWKEDFNMSFMSPIPSQQMAVDYVDLFAPSFMSDFYIGGHSKGGNLAVYSAMKCREVLLPNIIKVYSHDGPGFNEDNFSADDYQRIVDKTEKTIPESSLFGMLLDNFERYTVVKSSTFGGMLQHNPFTWVLNDDLTDFVTIGELNVSAKYRNTAINKWIGTLENDKRELFVEALFAVLRTLDISRFSEISPDPSAIMQSAKKLKEIDEDTKQLIGETVKQLGEIYLQTVRKKE